MAIRVSMMRGDNFLTSPWLFFDCCEWPVTLRTDRMEKLRAETGSHEELLPSLESLLGSLDFGFDSVLWCLLPLELFVWLCLGTRRHRRT